MPDPLNVVIDISHFNRNPAGFLNLPLPTLLESSTKQLTAFLSASFISKKGADTLERKIELAYNTLSFSTSTNSDIPA